MSKIAIISGGHRPSGNSPRIARHIEAELKKKGHSTYLLDLSEDTVPFWDEGMWGVEPLAAKWQKAWNPIAEQLTAAEGFVIVSPEYHGMVPSKLINFFLLTGNGPLVAHKPALLVADSSSLGGAYPAMELRAVSTKNNRMVYLPEHLLVRNANEMFVANPKPEFAHHAELLAKRLDWTLEMLENYIQGFNTIRERGGLFSADFANGM